jgi:hypothetical protein
MLAGVLRLAAQTTSLQGIVNDAQGAVVPGAIVSITNTDTSASRKELTNGKGDYEFLQILPGPYRIEVQMPGFASKVTNLVLQVNEPATLNLQLMPPWEIRSTKRRSRRFRCRRATWWRC